MEKNSRKSTKNKSKTYSKLKLTFEAQISRLDKERIKETMNVKIDIIELILEKQLRSKNE